MRYSTIFVILSLTCLDVSAQPWASRLTVTLSGGGTIGGPSSDIEAHMRNSGFGKTTPAQCFFICSGPIEHPRTYGGGAGLGVSMGYQLNKTLTAGLYFSHRNFGQTLGNANAGLGGLLFLNKSINSFETMLYIGPSSVLPPRRIAFGVGFGVYQLSIRRTDAAGLGNRRFRAARLGAVAGPVFRLPFGRFFVEGRLSYRLISKCEYGPFEVTAVDQTWTLRESKASFTGAEFAIGLGFRLGPKSPD